MKEKFEQEQKDNHNHIENLTMDMPDMEDDEKFRQWLEETYINEAELIEKSLLAGQEYEKNLDIAEELSVPREKFYQRLKEEGLYEDEADDTSEVSKKAVRGVGTETAGDAAAKKNNASVSGTAGEKIISMEARTSKEAGERGESNHEIKLSAMESGGSKKANTAAKATEGLQRVCEDRDSSRENGNEAVVGEENRRMSSHGQKEAGLSAAGQSRRGGRSMFDVRVCREHDQRGE